MRIILVVLMGLNWTLLQVQAQMLDEPQFGLVGCQWQASMAYIPEPWHNHTKTFAQGAIRVTHATIGEDPECHCGEYLIILAPQRKDEDEGHRQCLMLVALPQEQGFSIIDFKGLSSRYDPDLGLIVSIRVQRHKIPQMYKVKIRFHDATGIVSLIP